MQSTRLCPQSYSGQLGVNPENVVNLDTTADTLKEVPFRLDTASFVIPDRILPNQINSVPERLLLEGYSGVLPPEVHN